MAAPQIISNINSALGTNVPELYYEKEGNWFNDVDRLIYPMMLCSKYGYVVFLNDTQLTSFVGFKNSTGKSFHINPSIKSYNNYKSYPSAQRQFIWNNLMQIKGVKPLP